MHLADLVPNWAPRIPQWKIRKLYETDARGIYDEELIDDVGWSLLARCQDFIAANDAVAGKVHCPRCSSIIPHGGSKEELLRCDCGWQLPWGEYFKTIQHKQLSGAEPVRRLFRDFIAQFPAAGSARERMVLIDFLLHGFHWYYKTGDPTRPVAINLIEGRLNEVIRFLDSLTYSDNRSTPGTLQAKAEWDRNIGEALRAWPTMSSRNAGAESLLSGRSR